MRGVPQTGYPEGEPDRGAAFDAGSRTHADKDSAEACGVTGNRVYRRCSRQL